MGGSSAYGLFLVLEQGYQTVFGDQVIIDASSNHKAKVADFIDNGNLWWPHNRTWELDEIVDSGFNVLPSAQEDRIILEGAMDG